MFNRIDGTRSVHQCSCVHRSHFTCQASPRKGVELLGHLGRRAQVMKVENDGMSLGWGMMKQQIKEVMKDEFALDAIEIVAAPPKKKRYIRLLWYGLCKFSSSWWPCQSKGLPIEVFMQIRCQGNLASPLQRLLKTRQSCLHSPAILDANSTFTASRHIS